MKQIRNNVFETNSSSSHSISIGPIKKKEVNKNIPRNIKLYEVPEYEIANGHEDRTVSNTLMTEVSKLSFLFNLVATCIKNEFEDDYDDYIVTTFSCLCGRAVSESDVADQRKAISQDLIYMKWIQEMVQEETGTLIKIPIPKEKRYNEFPYFDTLWTEEHDDFYEEIKKSIEDQDEALFKALCREVVFNPEVIIKDIDAAYSCDYEEHVL